MLLHVLPHGPMHSQQAATLRSAQRRAQTSAKAARVGTDSSRFVLKELRSYLAKAHAGPAGKPDRMMMSLLTGPFAVDLEELRPALRILAYYTEVDSRKLDTHLEQGLSRRQGNS